MISDVLSDAVAAIEEYERLYPECYSQQTTKMKIAYAKAVMTALREDLDSPLDAEPWQ